MNSKDLPITVLMTCYNAEYWLDETIQSVLNQSFRNFEFVIINDGSIDKTLDIILSYARKDSRITVLDKQNTGLTESLNFGLRASRGKWIARLDADDLCEPNRLEVQYNYILSRPNLVLIGSNFYEIDFEGALVKNQTYPNNHKNLVRNLERHKRFFPHSSAFFRRDIALNIGGYNTRFQRSQDHDLWLRLSRKGQIGSIGKSLVKIRKHNCQISHEEHGLKQLCYDYASTVCHFLRNNGIEDPSASFNDTDWKYFFDWIKHQVTSEVEIIERKKFMVEQRDLYFNEKYRLISIIRFIAEVIKSGYFLRSVEEKLFGSDLPKKLATRWCTFYAKQ